MSEIKAVYVIVVESLDYSLLAAAKTTKARIYYIYWWLCIIKYQVTLEVFKSIL